MSPEVHGLDNKLVGGKLYTAVCVAPFANPPAEISWYKNGQKWSPRSVEISSFIGYYV